MPDSEVLSAAPEWSMDKVPARAERLLQAMQKVFSHDLPNQLVVVQSLISLLGEDETGLSADGQEQLRRLRFAAGKAGQMVHFLKEMARLTKLSETIEGVRLSALMREIQGELHQLYPEREVRVETSWELSTLAAGRRSFQQALLNLLRCGIDYFANKVLLVDLSAVEEMGNAQIRVRVQPGEGPLLSMPSFAAQDRTLPEQRMGFILARELLSLSGGSLSACSVPSCSFCFVVLVPLHVKHA